MAAKQATGNRALTVTQQRAVAADVSKTSVKADSPLYVVGIGASARGFESLVEFFRVMPPNSGAAFVILQHLGSSSRSVSVEVFARHTKMSVYVATDGVPLQPDCVYTPPAGEDIRVVDGSIRLSKPPDRTGHRLPIDNFFCSLSRDPCVRAIGIILSGTGSDGATGLKDIVGTGGIVIVQTPETAEFDGMPRSAIATSLVSHVLPIAKIPRVVVAHVRNAQVRNERSSTTPSETGADPLSEVLVLLQAGHGQSFVGYKPAMLSRRIERRMGLLNIENLDDYIGHLRRDVVEVAALRKDLLIGVTEFFRDPEAWEAFGTEVLSPHIAAKKPGEPIRAWVAGTGTGEEAYTLAILVLECLRQLKKRCVVQIFGTDANQDTLKIARAGRYSRNIRAQISADILKRYFREIKGDDCYQVIPGVRESVIFGDHDLLADPPYSRLDLVTCRNLLIYMEPAVQERILRQFHFALRLKGHLFLGSAETVGVYGTLFRPVATKWHIYQRVGLTDRTRTEDRTESSLRHVRPLQRRPLSDLGRQALHASQARNALLDRFAPAAVLVDENMEPLYFNGAVDRFLSPARRTVKTGLLARMPKSLRLQMPTALRRAQLGQHPVTILGAKRSKGGSATFQIEIVPLSYGTGESSDPRYLIAFVAMPARGPESRAAQNQLQHELRTTQNHLQSAVSQLKTSNEELRASHEEMMSVNEELQSMNEELESSKEELQSVNEELNTVNAQLHIKVGELEVANTDLRNLLASNEVATLCLDGSLHIKWFTPAAHRLFNFLPSDIGRPVSDLAVTLVDSTLIEHSSAVLKDQASQSRELEYNGTYLRRIVPYRAEASAIAGVIITFADITEAKRASAEEIHSRALANERLEARVRERTEELGRLSRELALAEVRERQTIARDLHDGLGQALNVASIKLDAVRALDKASRTDAALDEIASLMDGIVAEMRSLTAQLNPPVLEQLGLIPALEWLGEEMHKTYHLEVSLTDDAEPKPLDSVTASTLFRAVRELLINVARHAKVKCVHVNTRSLGDIVSLQVIDEGTGFAHAGNQRRSSTGLGLATLSERIAYIGGTLDIYSERNRGTTATIRAPFRKS